MSINWPHVEPAPALLTLPPGAVSLDEADAAIELWEHYSRKTLDPTQRLAVYVMMAQDASGRWAAATTGREMSRQNGKGDEVEVVELWGLVQRSEAILHTIHDAVLLATQTQQRMLAVLEGHPDLRRLVKRKWQGTGQQMIEMHNGGIIWYRTRAGGGGRGVDDIDRLVIDEAQHATEEHLAAVSPTLFENQNPQLNALGTAGLAGHSEWWWGIRRRALSGNAGRFGYVGHTAERVYLDDDGEVVQEPVDQFDRSLWPGANPSAVHRPAGKMEFLEEQLRTIPETFAREHLCVWDPPPGIRSTEKVIPLVVWRALAVAGDGPGWLSSPVTVGIDCTPDGSFSSIAVAGECPEGGVGVEVADHHAGMDWVPSRVADMVAAHRPKAVLIDGRSAAGALIRPLAALGVTVTEVNTDAMTRGAGEFLADVHAGLVHHRSRPVLDDAVESAGRRQVGNAWTWERRDRVASPLVAVTLARWGHLEIEAPPVESVYERRGAVVL